jgi:putative RNA 2'-phosphotransferase
MDRTIIRISKFLSYILRHNPAKFNLKISKNGCVDVEEVLTIIKSKFPGFNKERLKELVAQDPKERFQILNNKIRATYGHSIPVELPDQPIKPPEVLYHGTSMQAQAKILNTGLKPMHRQFVHLSQNQKVAFSVGLRHAQQPAILKILALDAHQKGIKFYRQANTYLAKFIPKEYIRPWALIRKGGGYAGNC